MTVTVTKPPNCKPQIPRHFVWRHRLQGDPSLGKMPQKILGASAVIVDHDKIEPLLRQRLLQFSDQRPGVLWHENLLDCV